MCPGACSGIPAWWSGIAQMLAAAGAPADCLEIEIIENVLMSDIEHVSPHPRPPRRDGCPYRHRRLRHRLFLVGLPRKLPLRTLKIDKSFVLDMTHTTTTPPSSAPSLTSRTTFGYWVVAEGIEKSVTHRMLTELGCDSAQGFHFSHRCRPRISPACWPPRARNACTADGRGF